AQGRLNRIDTTPVTVAADVSNEYANGKPVVLTYPGSTSGDPRLDTNVASVVYPEQVLDSSNTPRIQLTYGTTGFELDKVTAQTGGGTNGSGVVAGGSLSFEYTDLMVAMPALNDAVATTEVTD